jgi:hypothetical protein
MSGEGEQQRRGPISADLVALNELATQLLAESWVDDLEPGLEVVAKELGFEVWGVSRSRGRLRLGTLPHVTIAARARAIRVRRN